MTEPTQAEAAREKMTPSEFIDHYVQDHQMYHANVSWCMAAIMEAYAAHCRQEDAKRQQMKGVTELAAELPNLAEYCKHWENRAEKAEARIKELAADLAALRASFPARAQKAAEKIWIHRSPIPKKEIEAIILRVLQQPPGSPK